MAKGQKRSNREAKKPKASKANKKKTPPSPGTVTTALAKPRSSAAAPESKK